MDRISWREPFCGGQAPKVVEALCNAWRELVSASPDTFHMGAHEPDLTVLLGEHLRATRGFTKLTGQWSYEQRHGLIKQVSSHGLKVVKPKRTDIQYFSDREDPPLDLVFEFKKLDHRQSRRTVYVGPDGMDRFIRGTYSLRQPAALMVGILLEHRDDCVPPLIRWLNGPDAKTQLYMGTVAGHQTQSPSALFPACAEFDTEHIRPPGFGPAHQTILIAHLFLGFPDPPRAQTKRQRRQAILQALECDPP